MGDRYRKTGEPNALSHAAVEPAAAQAAHSTTPQELLLSPSPQRLLKGAREGLGLSLQEVADACGVNIRQYQKFESGERDVRGCAFSLGLRVCRVLGLDPWLFERGPDQASGGRRAAPREEGSPDGPQQTGYFTLGEDMAPGAGASGKRVESPALSRRGQREKGAT